MPANDIRNYINLFENTNEVKLVESQNDYPEQFTHSTLDKYFIGLGLTRSNKKICDFGNTFDAAFHVRLYEGPGFVVSVANILTGASKGNPDQVSGTPMKIIWFFNGTNKNVDWNATNWEGVGHLLNKMLGL